MGIKHQPDDFQVDELLDPAVPIHNQPRPIAIYRLTKTTLDTPTALQLIAKALRVRPDRVQCAGLKDKHARTTQHVSVDFQRDLANKPQPASARGDNWSLEHLGYLDAPLTSRASLGNRFRIVVRGLTRRAGTEIEQAAADLRDDSATDTNHPTSNRSRLGVDESRNPSAIESAKPALLIVNYFGAQRFGSARGGEGFPAQHLVHGDYESALRLIIATPNRNDDKRLKAFHRAAAQHWRDWPRILATPCRHPQRVAVEFLATHPSDFRGAFAALPYFIQQINVEAYQSHLWNEAARRLIEQHCPASAIRTTPDPFGDMLFPAAAAVPASLRGLRDLNLPLIAPKTRLAEPWGAVMQSVLDDEGIRQDQLHLPGLRRPFFGESPRNLFITAQRFDLSDLQTDDHGPPHGEQKRFKRTIAFDLPRGAYATVVLRALGL